MCVCVTYCNHPKDEDFQECWNVSDAYLIYHRFMGFGVPKPPLPYSDF